MSKACHYQPCVTCCFNTERVDVLMFLCVDRLSETNSSVSDRSCSNNRCDCRPVFGGKVVLDSNISCFMQSRPILSLPLEVFLHIINLSLENHETRPLPYSRPSSLRLNPVLTAARVCRSWRRSIENAPTLWSSLHLDGEQDRARGAAKARFWAKRALGIPDVADQEGARRGLGGRGLRSIAFTRAQSFGDLLVNDVLNELRTMGAFTNGLEKFSISWVHGQGPTSTEQRQMEAIVRFLVRTSAQSLTDLTLHTSARLRLGFSLPRFGSTFSSLTSLEIRSLGSSASTTSLKEVWVPASYLPPYEGEEDWPPIGLRRLVLVNPIWRLQFLDGTIASPTLSHIDCPDLKEAILGPTSPPMTFDLFSGKGIRRLDILNQSNPATEPDPDLSGLATSVEELKLANSATLTNRLLGIILEKGLVFSNLRKLDLTGALISSTHLSMFGSTQSPFLSHLTLSSTTWIVRRQTTTIDGSFTAVDEPICLPLLPSLQSLNVADVAWVNSNLISSLATSVPQLRRLGLDGCQGLQSCITSLLEYVDTKGKDGLAELSMLRCVGVETSAVNWLRGMVRVGGFAHKNVKLT